MASPQRLNGVKRSLLDRHKPGEEWEEPNAPADFVAGPVGTGVTYLPNWTLGLKLTKGSSGALAVSVQNPGPVDLHIVSLFAEVTQGGADGAHIDFGLVDGSTKTASDLGLGIVVSSSGVVPVVAGGAKHLWQKAGASSDSWLTGLIQSGCSSFAGRLIITAIPLYST